MAKKQNEIVVELKKNVIPTRVFGIKFEIKMGTRYLKKYTEELPKINEQIESKRKEVKILEGKNDLKALFELLEFIKSKIQEYTDLILGDGAFEKLYDVADEDLRVTLDEEHEDLFVVEEGMRQVTEQFQLIQTKSKAQSFIDGKKR